MARIRSLNPCAPMDDDVAAMSIHARFVWAYLPCHADREGRLKDAPFMIKAAILPGDEVDMNAILDELAARRHIVRYEVDGRRFIQIRSFARHQKPHTREIPSMIPPCPEKAVPEHDLGDAEAQPRSAGMSPSPSIPDPDPSPDPALSRAPACSETSANYAHGHHADPPVWPAAVWKLKFKIAWEAHRRYSGRFYGDTGDYKACEVLAAELERLPVEQRLAAQARSVEMFAEFMASDDQRACARRHPLCFFVQEFGALRTPAPTARASPSHPNGRPKPKELRVVR